MEAASRAPHQFAWAGLWLSCTQGGEKVRFKYTVLFILYLNIVSNVCLFASDCIERNKIPGTPDNKMQSKTITTYSTSFLLLLSYSCYYCHDPPVGKSKQPDGNLVSLCQSVPGSLQSTVDLSHLYGSFQPHHFQTLITHICGVT